MSTTPLTIDTSREGVPFARLVKVELRKMFNTRSGFWLMASILIVAALATTTDAGVYSVAIAVTEILWILPNSAAPPSLNCGAKNCSTVSLFNNLPSSSLVKSA